MDASCHGLLVVRQSDLNTRPDLSLLLRSFPALINQVSGLIFNCESHSRVRLARRLLESYDLHVKIL